MYLCICNTQQQEQQAPPLSNMGQIQRKYFIFFLVFVTILFKHDANGTNKKEQTRKQQQNFK